MHDTGFAPCQGPHQDYPHELILNFLVQVRQSPQCIKEQEIPVNMLCVFYCAFDR